MENSTPAVAAAWSLSFDDLLFVRSFPTASLLGCAVQEARNRCHADIGTTDVRLDVTVPASGQGPRAEPGEFRGLGAAYCLPIPDETGSAGGKATKSNNVIKSTSYDSRH